MRCGGYAGNKQHVEMEVAVWELRFGRSAPGATLRRATTSFKPPTARKSRCGCSPCWRIEDRGSDRQGFWMQGRRLGAKNRSECDLQGSPNKPQSSKIC